MFRSCIAFLLILSLTAANFSRLFIYAGFEWNKGFIASALCENKARPQLHCNGKCYLKKKLKDAEKKEKNQERESQKPFFMDALVAQAICLDQSFSYIGRSLVFELSSHTPRYSTTIFHPPKA